MLIYYRPIHCSTSRFYNSNISPLFLRECLPLWLEIGWSPVCNSFSPFVELNLFLFYGHLSDSAGESRPRFHHVDFPSTCPYLAFQKGRKAAGSRYLVTTLLLYCSLGCKIRCGWIAVLIFKLFNMLKYD